MKLAKTIAPADPKYRSSAIADLYQRVACCCSERRQMRSFLQRPASCADAQQHRYHRRCPVCYDPRDDSWKFLPRRLTISRKT